MGRERQVVNVTTRDIDFAVGNELCGIDQQPCAIPVDDPADRFRIAAHPEDVRRPADGNEFDPLISVDPIPGCIHENLPVGSDQSLFVDVKTDQLTDAG